MATVSSFHFYVLWKTEFQVVYLRLPALVRSILNIIDTVRTVKVLFIRPQRQFYGMCVSLY